MNRSVSRLKVPPVARILIALGLGAAFGSWYGPGESTLAAIGRVVIDMVKALAAPLLLFAIIDAFLRTEIRAKSGAWMVAIALTNALIAIAIGLTLSNVLQPGKLFATGGAVDPKAVQAYEARAKKLDIGQELLGYLPTNVIKPFADNAVVTIIILAVLAGAALRRVKDEQKSRGDRDYLVVEGFVATCYRAVEVVLGWVIVLIPLAVFAAVASAVGDRGFAVFRGLAAYVGVAILGMAIQVFVVYQAWVVFGARMPLRTFWRGAREAVIHALGVASSMATLPVTLRCLDRMKVSPRSARLAACVGTNLNNDGILLYEAMAVLFVAQAENISLSFDNQLTAALACVITGIGISGIPDAGLISLTIVLATVRLPVTILPTLLAVDWLLGRCRAATNVLSDILVAVLLDRFDPVEPSPQAALSDPDGI